MRRRIAGKLLKEDKGLREVARLVGASPSSVFRWKEATDAGGKPALAAKPHPGRPARLGALQKEALLALTRFVAIFHLTLSQPQLKHPLQHPHTRVRVDRPVPRSIHVAFLLVPILWLWINLGRYVRAAGEV
jgi:transposase